MMVTLKPSVWNSIKTIIQISKVGVNVVVNGHSHLESVKFHSNFPMHESINQWSPVIYCSLPNVWCKPDLLIIIGSHTGLQSHSWWYVFVMRIYFHLSQIHYTVMEGVTWFKTNFFLSDSFQVIIADQLCRNELAANLLQLEWNSN